jgi:hypothetical protein
MLLAGCRDAPPDDREAATAPDTAQLRMVAESAAAHDSSVVRNERTAVLAPAGEGWTTGSTAIQLSAGSLATLRSVRESEHEGFDRVVFDFGERSLPNYELAYVESPQHQCGSGEEVRLKGEAWLSMKLQPVQAHDDAGKATAGERSRLPAFSNLLELRMTCDFEGTVEWIAGVARPNGYRVMMLQQPTRLVVDVRH